MIYLFIYLFGWQVAMGKDVVRPGVVENIRQDVDKSLMELLANLKAQVKKMKKKNHLVILRSSPFLYKSFTFNFHSFCNLFSSSF
jgi:hypothetical protein